MDSKLKNLFLKQQYRFAGKHAAVKICHYTKQSLRGKDFCYKQKFYGIQSHRCLQMSPVSDICTLNCTFCWRPMDYTLGNKFSSQWAVGSLQLKTANHKLQTANLNDFDDPKQIVDNCIEAQKKLLIGFKGDENANQKKVLESFLPKHAAISLAGEPTLYPKLPELIKEFHKRGMTTFLVTNGTNPEMFKLLSKKRALPTQLYISISAPDEIFHRKINRPLIKNSWKNLQKSLAIMKKIKGRNVVRLTLIRSAMIMPENYAKMIKKANPMFVECKGYVHVGFSQKRLPVSEMPNHAEISAFAKKIAALTGYKIKNEKMESKVVLLARGTEKIKI